MKISTSPYMPADRWALMKDGKLVAVVQRGAPIEDAVCDEIIVPESDLEEIRGRTNTAAQ